MPHPTEEAMTEECRAAYERWVDEARETGKATIPDVWQAAWDAGRASESAE